MINFNDTENFLKAHSSNEIKPGLERISALLTALDNPQNGRSSFHIVGTNGKGSTGAYITSILQASGYTTAFYSSPHLTSPGERLLINGMPLTPEEWLNALKIAAEKISVGFEPSYFELLTAAAFLLIREKNVDVEIIEAGLGGRLDATNLLQDVICTVITSLSMDHMEFLGDTLEKIAGEKFAVVKKNVPACFSGDPKNLIPLFKKFCDDAGAVPFTLSENVKLENISIAQDACTFDFYTDNLEIKNVFTPLTGRFQIYNAALALSSVSRVLDRLKKITPENILLGLKNTCWPGRFEIISKRPLIILDGGHNFDGIRKLVNSVHDLYPHKKIGVIYTAMRDKDFRGCLELLSDVLNPAIYFTTVPNMQRAMTPEELLNAAKNFNWRNHPRAFILPEDALNQSINDKNDVNIICGSLYLIGNVREKLVTRFQN